MSQISKTEPERAKASEILRQYGKKFTRISGLFTNGKKGRCAMGVFVEYVGFKSADNDEIGEELFTKGTELHEKVKGILPYQHWYDVANMNNAGGSFEEISDYLEDLGL